MKMIISVSLASMVFLSGCASFSGAPEVLIDPSEEIKMLQSSFNSSQVLAYFSASPDSRDRRNIRNKIISTRLYALDLRFSEYTKTLSQELRGGAFGLDLLSIALTSAATIIDPGTTTTVLAGIDTVIKGGRQSFNQEVLIDKTLNILLTQMKADRKRISTQIWYSLSKRSDAEYPLPLALSQLEDYYQAGTISGAFISVEKSASLNSAEASKAFESNVIKVSFGKNKYTKTLNEYVYSAPNKSEENRRLDLIQAEIKKAGKTIFAEFLIDSNDKKYRSLQKQIVKALRLGGS